ncbi:MAG: hypothetical protein OK455_07745 [Thaumarchaeota archaeon]|nr:hypothetical protein [Nitrososphaerota archaeon]
MDVASERRRRALVRIFYSHAKKLYGTSLEERQISQIKDHFPPDSVVVDPARDVNQLGTAELEMQHFLEVIDQCDCLVFSRYRGVVTSGVLEEVNYALSKAKPVFELRRGGRIEPVKRNIPRSSKIDALRFIISESVKGIRPRR